MSTLKKTRPITIEEYLEGEKYSDIKHEYAGGEVYAMIGTSRTHNRIAGAFYATLLAHLKGTACGVFMSDVKLRIRNEFYYPDVLVACEPADAEPHYVTRPLLIVEVLSPGTAMRDATEKLIAYQAIDSLREYVLAEQERREVRVYRRAGTSWDLATYAGRTPIGLTSVDLTDPLNDIYGGILP